MIMPEREPKPDEDSEQKKPSPGDQPATDTSTDWDEWMKQHDGRPRPATDVADAEGRFTET
ncbi:MAG: hypothetical protein DMF82_06765 [Acidobacteria bacterium]|nr:MAG: hypothetical protein DMF82_06765 [Acidobacteriota bacterium]